MAVVALPAMFIRPPGGGSQRQPLRGFQQRTDGFALLAFQR
jgi:hypothetical protein